MGEQLLVKNSTKIFNFSTRVPPFLIKGLFQKIFPYNFYVFP